MKKTGARAANPIESEDPQGFKREIEPLDLSLDRIEARAFAQTEVLVGILQRDDAPHWRHWGLNE